METNLKNKALNELNSILTNAIFKSSLEQEKLKILKKSFLIEVPANNIHGDFATNLILCGAKIFKMAPNLFAEHIVHNVDLNGSFFEKFEFVKPGFLNFFLKNYWYEQVVLQICKINSNYGKLNLGNNKKVIIEFVSANPTGPMHIGNARGGAIGDCLAELFKWAGFDVFREFYLNDAGNQIEKFKTSLFLRYKQLFLNDENFEMPSDCYLGDDIIDLAKKFAKIHGKKFINCNEQFLKNELVKFALPLNVNALKTDLASYRINYNNWFKESSLYDCGAVNEIVEKLKEKGYVYEKDGAVWFEFSRCGGEKDEVLVRETGVATYFAADVAYHYNKLVKRNFDLAINVWGADHHGHVARIKGALEVLGVNSNCLKVVLMQLVRLVKNGEVVKLSKRAGGALTLKFLINEVPIDAARFFFNLREANSHFDFDINLALEKSNNNPVYYVQYAYARICQLLNKVNLNINEINLKNIVNLNYCFSAVEKNLIKTLVEFSDEIKASVENLNSSLIAKFAINLATKFHKFYAEERIIGCVKNELIAKVMLCQAVKIVLENLFSILKIEAKQKL